jgi:hypothetical protein
MSMIDGDHRKDRAETYGHLEVKETSTEEKGENVSVVKIARRLTH